MFEKHKNLIGVVEEKVLNWRFFDRLDDFEFFFLLGFIFLVPTAKEMMGQFEVFFFKFFTSVVFDLFLVGELFLTFHYWKDLHVFDRT